MHDAVRPKVIVGLGYGDEGKGMATGFLAGRLSRQGKDQVIRWNGAAQAAHNVPFMVGITHSRNSAVVCPVVVLRYRVMGCRYHHAH